MSYKEPEYWVVLRWEIGQTQSFEIYNSWYLAKERRNQLFKDNQMDISHIWVEKRFEGEPWNTKRYGEVLKRNKDI